MKTVVQIMNSVKEMNKKYLVLLVGMFLFLIGGTFLIPKVFAEPISSVELVSEKINYDDEVPGSWKVNKTAKWTGKGEAEITFDVDSILKSKSK